MVESVYHISCAEFLSDERLFLFEYEQSPHPGQFTVQLLDPSSQTVPKFADFSFEPSKYSEYVQSFTRDSSKIDPRKHHVFLVRNQKLNKDNTTILNGVVNENNLECRICLSTYRLFYVEDTEDFFFRPKASRPYARSTPVHTARHNVTKVLELLSGVPVVKTVQG
jgi:paired amphipathic helix protein Sin3a